MELYRRVVACEALEPQSVHYIRISHKEFKADDVMKALKIMGFQKMTDCRQVDRVLADCLVREGILLKTLGGRPCYKPVKGRFLAFYQEFIDHYWESEGILSEHDFLSEPELVRLDEKLDDQLDNLGDHLDHELDAWLNGLVDELLNDRNACIPFLKLLPKGSGQKAPKVRPHKDILA